MWSPLSGDGDPGDQPGIAIAAERRPHWPRRPAEEPLDPQASPKPRHDLSPRRSP